MRPELQVLPVQHAWPLAPQVAATPHTIAPPEEIPQVRPELQVLPEQQASPLAPHVAVAVPGTQKFVMPAGPPHVKPEGHSALVVQVR